MFTGVGGKRRCEAAGVEPGTWVADACWLLMPGTSGRMTGESGRIRAGGFGSRIWHKYSGASDDKIGPGRSSLLKMHATLDDLAACKSHSASHVEI